MSLAGGDESLAVSQAMAENKGLNCLLRPSSLKTVGMGLLELVCLILNDIKEAVAPRLHCHLPSLASTAVCTHSGCTRAGWL